MTETKAYLIADEKMGGVQREYIEVDRKADIGDYVRVTNAAYSFDMYNNGDIFKVERSNSLGVETDLVKSEGNDCGLIYLEEYTVLAPTDIVVIGNDENPNQHYRLEERKAQVGDKILIVKRRPSDDETRIGKVFNVIGIEDDVCVITDGLWDDDSLFNPSHKQYRVLIPVYSCDNCGSRLGEAACSNSKGGSYCSVKCAGEEEGSPDTQDESTPDLSTRVTSLERIVGELVRNKSSIESQLLDAQRNIERLAQDHELVKFKVVRLVQSYDSILDEVESNTKDIAFLDDRTFEKPGKPLTEIMKLSVTRFDGGEKHVEVSYLGDPTPEEVGKAITQAMKGGIN